MSISTSTQSVFTDFALGQEVDGSLYVAGLSSENWPSSGSGYAVLAAEQVFTSALYPTLWMAGDGGGSDSYLPQVLSGGSPVLYQQLSSSVVDGTPMVFGLSTSGELVVAAVQGSDGSWSAGQVLDVNPDLTDCAGFLMIPSDWESSTVGSPLVGVTGDGVPVVAAVYNDGWTAGSGAIPLNASASSYSGITSLYSPVTDQWYLFGISGGTPYVIARWTVDPDEGWWSEGGANGFSFSDSLNIFTLPTGATYASLYPVAAGNTLYLLAIDNAGYPYVASIQGSDGEWTAGGKHRDDQYLSLSPACDAAGNLVVFGVNTGSQIELVSTLAPGSTAWASSVRCETIYELGQPVTFTQAAVAAGPDGYLHCIGLGTNGQLYEVGIWNGTGVVTGQGRLPTTFAQNYVSAALFASQLFVDLNAQSVFSIAMSSDLGGWNGTAPFSMTATADVLASQTDPIAGIAVPSTPPDVLAALTLAAGSNVALWAGAYGAPAPGTGWPSGTTPEALVITSAGAVYYGTYDLSGVDWTFSNAVLSWPTPSPDDVDMGAPPVAGTLTFSMIEKSGTNLLGWQASFSGTLSGTLAPAPSDGPQPSSGSLCALESFTLASRVLAQGETTTATLTLSGLAPYPGAAVMIVPTSYTLWVPAWVIIPAGEASVTFTVGPFTSPGPMIGRFSITIGALVGTTALAQSVFVSAAPVFAEDEVFDDAGTLTCTFSPLPVYGGQQPTLTIAMSSPPAVAASFTVLGQNPSVADAAPGSGALSITPPASSVTGTITTHSVTREQAALFWVTQVAPEPRVQVVPSLTVSPAPEPADIQVTALTLVSPVVPGGASVNAVITLNAAPASALALSVTASDPSVTPPANVIVPANVASVVITLATSVVSQVTSVTISASNPQSSAGPVTVQLSEDVVTEVGSLKVSQDPIHDEATVGAMATLAAASAQSLTLTLSSNSPVLFVNSPVEVTIQANSTTASWQLTVNAPSPDAVAVELTVTGAADGPFSETVDVYPKSVPVETIVTIALTSGLTLVGMIGALLGWFFRRSGSVARNTVGVANTIANANTEVQEIAPGAADQVAQVVNTTPSRPAALGFGRMLDIEDIE